MGARFTETEIKLHKINFLAAFAENGNKRQAAQAAGISERTAHVWIKDDSKFAKLVTKANCKYLREK